MDPFKITGPTCISFSGGRTSAYMLWRVLEANDGLPKECVVCFANTGKEEEATLRFVDECEKRWLVPITWIEYQTEEPGFRTVSFETASRKGEPFAAVIAKKRYLPNPVARFCTSDLKVTPINKFLRDCGIDAEMMVGVRSDEPRRVGKLRARGLLLPLVDAGVDVREVIWFWGSQKFDLALQTINGKTTAGNCDLCFLKGAQQVQSLIAENPARARWWMQQEDRIGSTFRSDRPSYAQMLKFAQEQRDMFDPQEEAIPCFCGE